MSRLIVTQMLGTYALYWGLWKHKLVSGEKAKREMKCASFAARLARLRRVGIGIISLGHSLGSKIVRGITFKEHLVAPHVPLARGTACKSFGEITRHNQTGNSNA